MGASRELDFSEYSAARVQRFRRVAFALCGDWHSAEDLVQAMFVQLYRRWRRVRPDTVDAYARASCSTRSSPGAGKRAVST
ncbi:sigma factor [Amycolatopsis sp. NBC_01286]|uniref:sigma factor n=1 Tax=Amycolatopsis sp. NBC_01286 TaxID=2903560 RepID=UPI002E13992C|nr:hypothetical protein OG570_05655 [Amycolatopsis sp. NBC_01286]